MPTNRRERGTPLAWQILLTSSAVLLILIVAMLVYVNFQAHRFVTDRVTADLLHDRASIESEIQDQFADLTLTARLVASFPALKAVMAETDLPTIRDFLITYQQQNQAPDLLIVLDANGRVLARTDSANADPISDVRSRWLQPVLSGRTAFGTLPGHDAVYNATMVPSEAAGMVFGFVIAGKRIDNNFARKLSEVSDEEVVVLGERLLATTLPSAQLPWRSLNDWEKQTPPSTNPYLVQINRETYSAIPVRLAYTGAPVVLGLISDDKALAPYRRIQTGLLVLGLLAAAAGVAGSAVFAHKLTAPIDQLVAGTREVAAGNLDFRLDVRRRDEIGDLAESFNNMTRGLRERADMQKFVSQSTMQMIQSARQKTSAGERKLMTIFFSDIRGFTSLSERRDPEQVVQILNRVFTLQSEVVNKFSGDIDKFVGDAVMALFQGEDAPLNAVRCAAEIHQRLTLYNAQLPPGEPAVDLGIGITTGEVVLGSIGSEDRRDFTAIGSHVNLSARLCSMAKGGETLVAESTYRDIQGELSAERLQPQNIKGFSESVPIYRIVLSA